MHHLTTSLPYLLNRVGVRMGDLFGNELAADGLSVSAYRVLAALGEVEDQRLTDLAAVTSVELTTLSRLVAAMEARRLLRRRRPKDNLRTVQISLLAPGRALLAKYLPRAAQYERTAMTGLSAEEVRALKAALTSVYDNLDVIERQQAETAPARGGRAKAA